MSKYKVDSSNRKEIRNFIDVNFSSKTIIPITVNHVLLGGELIKHVYNGKIVDLIYYNMTNSNTQKVSLKDNFISQIIKLIL